MMNDAEKEDEKKEEAEKDAMMQELRYSPEGRGRKEWRNGGRNEGMKE